MQKTVRWVADGTGIVAAGDQKRHLRARLGKHLMSDVVLHTVGKKNNEVYPEGEYSPLFVRASANVCVCVQDRATIHNYTLCAPSDCM